MGGIREVTVDKIKVWEPPPFSLGFGEGFILNGNSFFILDEMAKMDRWRQSFQTSLSSCPYWGVRCYGIPVSIWPPEFTESCADEHQWGVVIPGHGSGDYGEQQGVFGRMLDGQGYARHVDRGCFCVKCGAWLGVLGLEPTIDLYIWHLVLVYRKVRVLLRKDGTLWVNIGDQYAQGGKRANAQEMEEHRQRTLEKGYGTDAFAGYRGHDRACQTVGGVLKHKDLTLAPERFAVAMQEDGWTVRGRIIWRKPNAAPRSIADNLTPDTEHIWFFSVGRKYFFNREAVRSDGRGSVDLREGRIRARILERRKNNATEKLLKKLAKSDLEGQQKMFSDLELGDEVVDLGLDIPGVLEGSAEDKTLMKRLKASKGADNGYPQSQEPYVGYLRTTWDIVTEPSPTEHSATFPDELARRCVALSTPDQCCQSCGMAFKPVIVKRRVPRESMRSVGIGERGYQGQETKDYKKSLAQMPSQTKSNIGRSMMNREIVGWEPRCGCSYAVPEKPWVLDPFAGVGTTTTVAALLGRNAAGIEMNAEFAAKAEEDLTLATGGMRLPRRERRARHKTEDIEGLDESEILDELFEEDEE